MKRFLCIFSIFFFVSFKINIIASAAPVSATKTLEQGIYKVRDTQLLLETPLNIKIAPANSSAIILVINANQTIESLVRLNPQLTQQVLPPLHVGSSVIIFGNGSVTFS